MALTAVTAVEAQRTALPGEKLATVLVARLAKGGSALDDEIAELEALIKARFRELPHAEMIASLPGMGTMLRAEFVAATGGDMDTSGNADHLAGYVGPAPAPRDSGRVSDNPRRPRRFHRALLQVSYLSSMVSLRTCPASRAYHDRKRFEGMGHKQTLLSPARRRVNVPWAMIRNGERYHHSPPVTAAA
ncbi:transposase [Spirillospora sp. CA-255316]